LDALGPRGYTVVEAYNTSIERWQRRGLELATADRVAIRLAGKHPWEIWGDAWWGDLLDEVRIAGQ
jgi:hypothetical protein